MQGPLEVLVEEPLLVRGGFLRTDQADALGGQERAEILEEAPVLGVHQLVDLLRDRGQGLRGREPVRPRGRVARPGSGA